MAELSGTFNAARLAAEGVDVPEELVDTQSASHVVWRAALAAAKAVATGASPTEAAEVVRGVASRCGNVFVVGALDLVRAGRRLTSDVAEPGLRAWGSQPAHRLAQQPRKGVALDGETGQAAELADLGSSGRIVGVSGRGDQQQGPDRERMRRRERCSEDASGGVGR